MQKSVILICFSTISTMFSGIFTFACGFYVLQLTGSGRLFGTYLSILAIIEILTMPIFGNIIDRHSNKKMLILGQVLSVVTLFIFSMVYHKDIVSIFGVMVVLVFIDMIVKTVVSSNLQYITQEHFERVVTIRQTIQSASMIVIPIVAGFLVTVVQIENLALLNSFTEFVGLILIFFLSFKPANALSKSKKFVEGISESVKYVFKDRNLTTLFLVSSIINFLGQSLTVGLPIIIVIHLGYSSAQLGVMESVLGGTLLLTYLALNFFSMKNNLKKMMTISMMILIVSLFIIASSKFFEAIPLWAYIVMIMGIIWIGIAIPINNVPTQIMLHNTIEEDYKSRVFALLQSLATVLNPLGLIFFGLVMPYNYGVVFLISAICMIFAMLYFIKNYQEHEVQA
ncbi:TPA: MFS transporter [Staphylococcus pseudintermedius]